MGPIRLRIQPPRSVAGAASFWTAALERRFLFSAPADAKERKRRSNAALQKVRAAVLNGKAPQVEAAVHVEHLARAERDRAGCQRHHGLAHVRWRAPAPD